MSLPTVLVIAALLASIVLVMGSTRRLWAFIAVAAAGVEALFAFHILKFSIRGINMMIVLGAALLIAGAAVWMSNSSKNTVTAATVVALVGCIQLFSAIF